jgi:hypothetical protein
MHIIARVPSLAVAGVLLLTTSRLHAQASTPSAGPTAAATAKPERRTVVTANPFAIVALYLTGDIERKIAPAVTIGAGGSIAGSDEFDDYRALDAKLRYYPNEKALHGFSVAATVGVVSGRQSVTFDGSSGTVRFDRTTRPTFGTDLSYQWLLGPKDRFATVLGFGFKRLFDTVNNSNDSFVLDTDFLPTARINIGFAF